jgi:hypothetical protein
MSLAAAAAALGSFELTVWAAPEPIGLLSLTKGDVGLPLGTAGDGDLAGVPFATAAGESMPSEEALFDCGVRLGSAIARATV